MAKLKEFEEEREKDKKRWTDFNSKVIQLQIIFLSIIFLVLVNESNMERCCFKING